MILMDDIIKDGHETLRMVAKEVSVPISKEDLDTMDLMIEYLKNSQDEELSLKYNLRGGVGLAAPQINVSKRFFAIYIQSENNQNIEFGIFNPEIIGESLEKGYLPGGEGCLSVPDKQGCVLRYKKIKVKGYFYNPNTKEIEYKKAMFQGYPAVVFQHEFDHLNGILFTDKIIDENDYKPLDI